MNTAMPYVECPECRVRAPDGRDCPVCLAPAPVRVPVGVLVSLPKAAPEPEVDEPITGELPGMFDLILRGQKKLNAVLRDDARLPRVVQRLLLVSVLGLAVHGLVLGLAAELVGLGGFFDRGHPIVWMPIASVLAFIGALCLCLPSFYFYTQLSGLDASFRLVTAQALRGQATTSVLLLGVIPFYAAWVMACVLGIYPDADTVLGVGMCLPFGVGLLGVAAIYRGFSDLARFLPITHQRRGNFLKRMVLAWGGIYTIVAPVALYRLGEALGARI